MLSGTPRILLLRPVTSGAAAAAFSAGAATTAWLPAVALVRERRPPCTGTLACTCCNSPQQVFHPLHQRCGLHHGPSACASPSPTPSALCGYQGTRRLPQVSPKPPSALRSPPFQPAAATSTPATSTSSAAAAAAVPAAHTSYSACAFSSDRHASKRRRAFTASRALDAASATPPPSGSSPSATSAGPSPGPPPQLQLQPPLPRGPPHPALISGLGQVIASASNYVRVEVYELLQADEPTPPDWRPPHLRARAAAAGTPNAAGAAEEAATPDPRTLSSHPGSAAGAFEVADRNAPGGPEAAAPTAAAPAPASPSVGPGPSLASPSASPLPHPPVILCSVRALLRKLRVDVVVGDVVRVGSIDWGQGRGVVSEVLPRSSRLVDPTVANVDHVMLVFALDQPPFEEQQVSRFLVASEAVGLPFTLVLNKADLVTPEVLSRRIEQCRLWGYEPVVLSCERGEGVEQVASVLQDRISVVAGPSGAGKSSLINCLRRGRHRPDLRPENDVDGPPGTPRGASPAICYVEDSIDLPPDLVRQYDSSGDAAGSVRCSTSRGSEGEDGNGDEEGRDGGFGQGDLTTVEAGGMPAVGDVGGSGGGDGGSEGSAGPEPEFLAVGALSKIGRGMHTTTAVTLLRLLGGGWLADTPGFGQPTLDDISSQQLGSCFPEVSALVSEQPCRFSDCLHVAEPGCSVSGAGLDRYGHYLRFLQEIKSREASDVRQLQRAKAEREGYVKTKSVRGGGERLEARLDSKKHRRASRQASKQGARMTDGE